MSKQIALQMQDYCKLKEKTCFNEKEEKKGERKKYEKQYNIT